MDKLVFASQEGVKKGSLDIKKALKPGGAAASG
jgi:hypothetical protein